MFCFVVVVVFRQLLRTHKKRKVNRWNWIRSRHILSINMTINMLHGDLFWYSMFLIKEFMVQKTKFYFVDVMCKLWKFIGQRAPNIQKQIKHALSVMHAKFHAFDCKVSLFTYNLRILQKLLVFIWIMFF